MYFRTIFSMGVLHIGQPHRLSFACRLMVCRIQVRQNLCPQFTSEISGVVMLSMHIGQSIVSVSGWTRFMKLYAIFGGLVRALCSSSTSNRNPRNRVIIS